VNLLVVLSHLMSKTCVLGDESAARADMAIKLFSSDQYDKLVTLGWDYRADCDVPIAEVVSEYILKKSDIDLNDKVNEVHLTEDAEKSLYRCIVKAEEVVPNLLSNLQYQEALNHLAHLKSPIDQFFDNVMVNTDDLKIRTNRLTLLKRLRALFLPIADISFLKIE